MVEQVRIGGIDVSIIEDDGVEGFGEWREAACEIRIRPGLTPQVLAATLLHEVIHAIGDAFGISLPEKTVRILEHGLLCALRADPEGAKEWLTSATEEEEEVEEDGD